MEWLPATLPRGPHKQHAPAASDRVTCTGDTGMRRRVVAAVLDVTAGPGTMMGVAERDRGEEELSAKPSWRGGPTGNGASTAKQSNPMPAFPQKT